MTDGHDSGHAPCVQRGCERDRRRGRPHRRLRSTGAAGSSNTWVVYTSDHGEMGGNHGMMSKCVLYDPAVRVPLILRPPVAAAPRVVDGLVEHLDVPATLREIASAPAVPTSEGRSLRGYVNGDVPEARTVSISENWGFATFMTERYKLVVDEDSDRAVPALRLRRGSERGRQPRRRSRVQAGGRRR